MRLEILPIILGALIGLIGLALIGDAALPDDIFLPVRERRRRRRAERHRGGELLVGLGTVGAAAAFLGRDHWRYGTLSVLLGAICFVIGAALNRRYLRELLLNRGPARRRDEEDEDDDAGLAEDSPERLRIR